MWDELIKSTLEKILLAGRFARWFWELLVRYPQPEDMEWWAFDLIEGDVILHP